MQALYTMTFEEFLTRWENDPQWVKVRTIIETIFQFNTPIAQEYLNCYQLLVDRYLYREIGAETESLFCHFMEDRAKALKLKWSDKVMAFQSKVIDKMNSRVLSTTDIKTYLSYLFPINSSSASLAAKNEDKFERQVPLFQNKTDTDLLLDILDLRDIYNDILYDFEPCFLGIY